MHKVATIVNSEILMPIFILQKFTRYFQDCQAILVLEILNLHLGAKYKKKLMIGLVLTGAILTAGWSW